MQAPAQYQTVITSACRTTEEPCALKNTVHGFLSERVGEPTPLPTSWPSAVAKSRLHTNVPSVVADERLRDYGRVDQPII